MDRRNFMQAILALGAAPAIVRADSLMRIVPIETTFVETNDWLEAWHDLTNTQALAKGHLCRYEGVRFVELRGGIAGRAALAQWWQVREDELIMERINRMVLR